MDRVAYEYYNFHVPSTTRRYALEFVVPKLFAAIHIYQPSSLCVTFSNFSSSLVSGSVCVYRMLNDGEENE